MTLTQRISRADDLPDFRAAVSQARSEFKNILQQIAQGALPALSICEQRKDLAPARDAAARIRTSARHAVVLGLTTLGAQALGQLRGFATPLHNLDAMGLHVHFLDNLDAPTFNRLLDLLPLKDTHFIAISKSGATAETLMQVWSLREILLARGIQNFADRITVVTEPHTSPLRAIADELGVPTLDYPAAIGGRYSILSLAGLFPALLFGVDVDGVRAGAAETLCAARERPEDCPAVEGAAFAIAAQRGGRIGTILMPYSDRLERFTHWYRQLWAESLGKDGKGTVPIRALGPLDQHSQLQLYLAGPNCAAFTIVTEDSSETGPVLPAQRATGELSYFSNKTMGALVRAEAQATLDTLIKHKRACRLIQLPALNERVFGALFMHFMLETIIAARMMSVNAFDQPAVEEGKVLARRYMSTGAH